MQPVLIETRHHDPDQRDEAHYRDAEIDVQQFLRHELANYRPLDTETIGCFGSSRPALGWYGLSFSMLVEALDRGERDAVRIDRRDALSVFVQAESVGEVLSQWSSVPDPLVVGDVVPPSYRERRDAVEDRL